MIHCRYRAKVSLFMCESILSYTSESSDGGQWIGDTKKNIAQFEIMETGTM